MLCRCFIFKKMSKVLILSQAQLESSTEEVCKWLECFQQPYLRYNGEDLFDLQQLCDLPNDSEFRKAWYRRKVSKFPVDYAFREPHFENQYTMRRFLNSEFNILHSYLLNKISLFKWVNNPVQDAQLNKLSVLDRAASCGLRTPYTNVLTDKDSLGKVLDQYAEVIVKPLSESIFFEEKIYVNYNMLTKIINKKNIKYAPEKFFPSLIQECINKKMEIRSFYLYGKIYSMAIFSQANKQTQEDFRNYDSQRPNRTVPFQLPGHIEEALRRLMEGLQFNTGSIDLIWALNGEYYFLEVNPEGQFGMVSEPCNYYLHKKMALALKNN